VRGDGGHVDNAAAARLAQVGQGELGAVGVALDVDGEDLFWGEERDVMRAKRE
jgi:hypothetical protein